MFEIGECIIYGTTGVCKIADITTINMEGAVKGRLYYILEPLGVAGSRIFTLVDNEKTVMRSIMSKENAYELLDQIMTIEPFCFQNEKQKEGTYKEALKSCDCSKWIKIIKTIYPFKRERQSKGKRLNSVDERYLKKAEDNLYSELSIPLGIPKDKMVEFMVGKIENLEAVFVS